MASVSSSESILLVGAAFFERLALVADLALINISFDIKCSFSKQGVSILSFTLNRSHVNFCSHHHWHSDFSISGIKKTLSGTEGHSFNFRDCPWQSGTVGMYALWRELHLTRPTNLDVCWLKESYMLVLPSGENPSCEQTTEASLWSQSSSQTVPQSPSRHISTLPSMSEFPPTNLTSFSLQTWQLTVKKWKHYVGSFNQRPKCTYLQWRSSLTPEDSTKSSLVHRKPTLWSRVLKAKPVDITLTMM